MRPAVHYLAHNDPPLESNYSRPRPSYFRKIHFNIILRSITMAFKWSLTSRFPNQTSVCLFLLLHHPHNSFSSIWSPNQYLVKYTNYETPHYEMLLSMLLRTPLRPNYPQQHPIPQYSQRKFFNVKHQFSQSYKISICCILNVSGQRVSGSDFLRTL
jgi:hypothetical protein